GDDLAEGRGGGRDLGEHLLASGPAVEPTDDASTVVRIDGQDDILGHGGLRGQHLLSPPGQNPRRPQPPSSGEFTRPAGETASSSYHLRGYCRPPFAPAPLSP